jgi:TetR/AcrR family transcriptional regulator, cholesterol catabolism regulator
MNQPTSPVTPVTRAQQERYDRVVAAATEALSAGGKDAVQMKELAQRAGVSLATLYRYFPSKEYVLLAVSLTRYEEAAHKVFAQVPDGRTVRHRVTKHLMREFRAMEREPRLTAALTQVMTNTERSYSAMIETVEHLHMQILRYVAGAGGPVTGQQQKLLSVVIDICAGAAQRWLAGTYSAAEVRWQIESGCELLELPDDAVDAELERAEPEIAIRRAG